ncbi:MAG: alpha/beta hydrolase [Spirochaetales bacterium]|nr:alpha/beta hydrolase [Spirochaetales bacterium]
MKIKFWDRDSKKITLQEYMHDEGPSKTEGPLPYVEEFLLGTDRISPAFLVLPGGGYDHLAEHEGAPVAEWLNSIGISAFVLHYRHAPYKYPAPLVDALRAMQYIRYHASEFRIDPDRIGILGFSAGGHLAMLVSTLDEYPALHENDPVRKVSARPSCTVLCYPVISFLHEPHQGVIDNLCGENPKTSLLKKLSGEHRVNEHMPPVFLWHTREDASVSVQHSILFADALKKHSVSYEMHLFEKGGHGLGLKPEAPEEVRQWPVLCEQWLKKQEF